MNEVYPQAGKGTSGNHGKQRNQNQGSFWSIIVSFVIL